MLSWQVLGVTEPFPQAHHDSYKTVLHPQYFENYMVTLYT